MSWVGSWMDMIFKNEKSIKKNSKTRPKKSTYPIISTFFNFILFSYERKKISKVLVINQILFPKRT